MPSSLKLYTTGNMAAAHLHNSPNYTAGYPPTNCLDSNLDTIWKIGASVVKTIDIDLGSSKTVDAVILFVKNYLTAVGCCDVSWSDNGSSWTQVTGYFAMTDTATPIRIKTNGLGLTHRYWRFVLSYVNAYSVSGIWCGSYYNVAQGNEYPEAEADRFYNRLSALPGGRKAVAGINRRSSRIFSRTYQMSGLTNFNALRNAHQDSNGILHPLVLNEGTVQSSALMVKFADDDFYHNPFDYQFYNPTVRFEEIPYIDDGETF